jgi:hypothetical protein
MLLVESAHEIIWVSFLKCDECLYSPYVDKTNEQDCFDDGLKSIDELFDLDV